MKKILAILGGLLVALSLTTPANAASMSIVSDTDIDIVGVYNKAGGPANFVSTSGKAVIAAEPINYPTIYSVDAMNSVWDNGTSLYFQNTNPGAKWIWDTTKVEDASALAAPLTDSEASSNGRVVVFEKTFSINGTPQSATMNIAADNCYEVWVNGNHIARSDTAPNAGWELTSLYENDCHSSGWQTVGHYSISASYLLQGTNTIKVLAGNEYFSPDNASFESNNSPVPPYVENPYRQQNPGAMIFKMDVDYDSVLPLEVTKTAVTSYTRTWDWTIDKTADKSALTLAIGEPYTAKYNVNVNATSKDSDWAVAGNITIHNPNEVAVDVTTVTDSVGGVTATVNCPQTLPYSLPAEADLVCTYSADLTNGTQLVNTATVNEGPTGTADVIFSEPTTVTDECIHVTDTYAGPLGTVCTGVDTLPKAFTYNRMIGPFGKWGTYNIDNTASFVTNDTEKRVDDSWKVVVFVPYLGCTLTQGYWKNHSQVGKAPYDDAWALLGPEEETKVFFLSGKTWLEVFRTPPSGGNAYYQLAHQFMAAKLNILNGASVPPSVQTAINTAVTLFNTYTPAQIGALKANSAIRQQFISLAGTLGSYNEGTIGPGHCDEQNDVLPTITGQWNLSVNNGAFLHDMVIAVQDVNGVLTGFGGYQTGQGPVYPYPYNWTLAGQITGNDISITVLYQNGYTATLTGTVDPTWKIMSGGAGTGGVTDWSATKL